MTHRAPPIRKATLVSAPIAHTFAVFVREIGTWWPVRPCSSGQGRVCAVTSELTRVAVEHRGWETLDDEQLREDCAAPGS
jgi:hypothetical protein